MAKGVAENKAQGDALGLLIQYYKTGDLQTWDDYNVAWTAATEGNIDYINSFIEVYNDPLGYRGSYETIVQIKDFDMSAKMAVLSENAQWFVSKLIMTYLYFGYANQMFYFLNHSQDTWSSFVSNFFSNASQSK